MRSYPVAGDVDVGGGVEVGKEGEAAREKKAFLGMTGDDKRRLVGDESEQWLT